MVKLQKMRRGTFIISIPKIYVKDMKWTDGEQFALCPCGNGALRIVPTRGKGLV